MRLRSIASVCLAVAFAGGGVVASATAQAAPGRRKGATLGELVEQIREAETVVVDAERAAAKDVVATEKQLAKRLVEGQLRLAEGDHEGAAIVFLDLVENYPDSQAGPQAVYYLGEALTRLNMERWAIELFSRNLGDRRPEAARFHQRSVARLFDLSIPRREEGFARRPGLSATPEVRARLQAVGIDVSTAPPRGLVSDDDAERLVRWAESFGRANREPQLRYAYGRWLYLRGRNAEARDELDSLSPFDIPISRGGADAKWRIRASYIAAAATLAMGEIEEAVERFSRITKARPSDPADRQIVELAWMAVARIHHDSDRADEAVKAYRHIGRDSPFFPEAMYETAWTLLRARRYDQAVQALDLLLIYDPDSPIAGEIKQLRGKVKIQRRDYQGAEEEFLTLRREFDGLSKQLARKLRAQGDAQDYFAAVIGEDMEHFSLGTVLPVGAVPVARTLPRAVHGEKLAREVGALERELDETRALLARMEEAVQAKEKARLFNDYGAHVASLDNVDDELVDVREQLVFRVRGKTRGRGVDTLEATRRALRNKVDRPLEGEAASQAEASEKLEHLLEQVHKADLMIGALRAQLVGTERYYEETRKDQKIDHQGFLVQATEQRDTIAALEKEVSALRDRITRAQASLRYADPLRDARRQAMADYRRHLATMFAALSQASPDPEAGTLWSRVEKLQARADGARVALDRAAGARLQDAIRILVEERANLDRYLVELRGTKTTTKTLVGEVMAAAYEDVVGELANMVMRSEVGLLDVAWAMKEAETEEVHRLEMERSRDLDNLENALDMGLEELGQ